MSESWRTWTQATVLTAVQRERWQINLRGIGQSTWD